MISELEVCTFRAAPPGSGWNPAEITAGRPFPFDTKLVDTFSDPGPPVLMIVGPLFGEVELKVRVCTVVGWFWRSTDPVPITVRPEEGSSWPACCRTTDPPESTVNGPGVALPLSPRAKVPPITVVPAV
jgi:hypothetical protein